LANFVGIVVGFFNVWEIRLRRLLLAAALSFDRVRNQRARNKNNFLPYREVTPGRRQLQIEMALHLYICSGNMEKVKQNMGEYLSFTCALA
jgi:hypothetical protein